MKFVRLSTVAALAAAIASGTLLFATSQRVQKAETKWETLTAEKERQQETLRVLRAEWDYLNRPDRIEALASRYLGMETPGLSTVSATPGFLPDPFHPAPPARKPAFSGLEPQPAVFHPPAPSVTKSHEPPPETSQDNFTSLINSLSSGDGSP